jgi:hypothetical protein
MLLSRFNSNPCDLCSTQCESMHSRNLVNCCDWFCRGQSIYDIDKSGYTLVRHYGIGTEWKVLEQSPKTKFAFLIPTITYVKNDDTLRCIANMLGQELRNSKKLVFNGRKSTTSNSVEHFTNSLAREVELMPHQHRVANFYCGMESDLMKLDYMNVLGSGEYAKALKHCNNVQEYFGGRALFDCLHRVYRSPGSYMFGACYHMGSDDSSDQVTYYQGHLDKAFVSSALLIPLGVSFFTFVSFPTAWHYQQDEASLESYNNWINTLSENERVSVANFTKAFKEDAKIPMKNVDCGIFIFENKMGSLLAFPTNICYHTTITPRSNSPRDLLIVHPLV